MAISTGSDDILEVWKFKSSGFMALCREVIEFVDSGNAAHYNLDVSKVWFREGEDTLVAVFPVLPYPKPGDIFTDAEGHVWLMEVPQSGKTATAKFVWSNREGHVPYHNDHDLEYEPVPVPVPDIKRPFRVVFNVREV